MKLTELFEAAQAGNVVVTLSSKSKFSQQQVTSVFLLSHEQETPNRIPFMIADVRPKGNKLDIELEWSAPISKNDAERIRKKVEKQLNVPVDLEGFSGKGLKKAPVKEEKDPHAWMQKAVNKLLNAGDKAALLKKSDDDLIYIVRQAEKAGALHYSPAKKLLPFVQAWRENASKAD